MNSKEIQTIIDGISLWAKKAKKFKWMRFGTKDDDWYDDDEVAASIQEHIGLNKLIEDSHKLKRKKKNVRT